MIEAASIKAAQIIFARASVLPVPVLTSLLFNGARIAERCLLAAIGA